MEFSNSSVQEESICNNGEISKRENSPQIDYMNKINDKPWGKEYLAFQNKFIEFLFRFFPVYCCCS